MEFPDSKKIIDLYSPNDLFKEEIFSTQENDSAGHIDLRTDESISESDSESSVINESYEINQHELYENLLITFIYFLMLIFFFSFFN